MKDLSKLQKLYESKPKYRRFLLEVYPQIYNGNKKLELSQVYSHRIIRSVLRQLNLRPMRINQSKKFVIVK